MKATVKWQKDNCVSENLPKETIKVTMKRSELWAIAIASVIATLIEKCK